MKAGSPFVVDTNVLLVANEQHPEVSPDCVIACVNILELLRRTGVVVLDDGYEMLAEYSHKTVPNTVNRVGDAFLKWLYQNAGNGDHVTSVHITDHVEREYEEFPNDEELHEFDRSDRKFVAVAVAHSQRPPILQGTDSKWMKWSERLAVHGITIQFLCPADVTRFLQRKRLRGAQREPGHNR
ncbi:MAG: hypothetical protein WBE45_17725 [Terriglobales bacterium]